MSKADVHVKLESDLADAIRRYAKGHGISFTAALSSLAARGLSDSDGGITITRIAERAAPAGPDS